MVLNNDKETILIVDDEPKNLGVVSDFLKEEGFRIASASSGELAIERAKTILPDLILLDISMPGMGGLEACRRLKEGSETSSIPVLFMTALSDVEDKVRGFEAGAVDYITKPIQKAELLARVHTHLKLYRYSAHLEREVIRKSEEIHESRNMLADTIDAMPSAIIGVTTRGVVNLWNHEAVELTGHESHEVIGRQLSDILPSLKLNLKEFEDLLISLREVNIPTIHTKERERYEYAHISSYELHREGLSGVIIRIDDVTESHQREEILHHSQKMQAIGELASGVAHDFNNQLAGILGSAELLAMDLEGDKNSIEVIETIQAGVKRSADLTRQLLSFARKGKMVSSVVPLYPMIQEIKELLKHGLNKDIEIEIDSDSEEYAVLGDSSQLQNAFLNLGINARDAIDASGKITYTLRHVDYAVPTNGLSAGEYAHISVSDTGSGIPQEIAEKIFRPFFTTKEEGKGTGMGLAAVKGAVQSHSGDITLETTEGSGSIFHVYLPLTEVDDLKEYQDERSRSSDKLSILCVDDEPLLCDLIGNLLKRLGHSVTAVNSGADAFDEYRRNEYDLVILDMIMPGIDGAATFKLLHQYDQGVKVVIASGYTDSVISQSLFEMGVKEFLLKPYQLSDLTKVIDSIYER